VVEFFVFSIAITLGFLSYTSYKSLIRQASETKLISVASSTASVIDPEKLVLIQEEKDTMSENYLEIRKNLQKIKNANPAVDDIYLMKKSAYENILNFILNASETEDKNGNGIIEEDEEEVKFEEEYEISSLPEIKKSFENPTTDKEINCDKWGCWLSGYAPIKNNNDETIAIVGVDISAKQILDYEFQIRKELFLTLGIIFLIFPVFLFFFLQYLLKPISKIINGINGFRKNLKNRIEINENNEFSLIAKNFNQMALDLEILYTQMGEKVREKTKTLIEIARKALEEKTRYEAFIDSVGEGVIVTDKNNNIIMINKQTEIFLNKKSEELLGKRTDEIYDVEDEFEKKLENSEKPLQKTLLAGKKISGKYYCLHNDRKIPVFVNATPVICESEIIGAILLFRDISRENEIDRAKTEFVSLASHQLRTPLSIINWYSEALTQNQNNFSKEQKNYMKKICNANQRMINLVKSLLNTSRLEMNTFSIKNKEIDLVKIARNTLEEVAELCSVQNISIEEKFSSETIRLKGDPQLLTIILHNLLTNAIKYSKRDGKIILEIFEQKTDIIIDVIDQGIGIPEKQKKEIFTRFFRANNAKEKDAEGTGLGLYIIKTTVEKLGGKITFDSKEKKGTTFSVILPKNGTLEKESAKKLI